MECCFIYQNISDIETENNKLVHVNSYKMKQKWFFRGGGHQKRRGIKMVSRPAFLSFFFFQ